jgi:methyl-accepting chemotaxis protein/aerotaxis receptor
MQKANDSVSRMDKVKSEMENINSLIENIESMMMTVNRHTEQQKEVAVAVSTAIDNLERIGESNAVSSEEITASMLELSKIAGNTREKINVFSLDDEIIDGEKEEAETDRTSDEVEFDLDKALKDATEYKP